jgi:hypothetical protein
MLDAEPQRTLKSAYELRKRLGPVVALVPYDPKDAAARDDVDVVASVSAERDEATAL